MERANDDGIPAAEDKFEMSPFQQSLERFARSIVPR
jgi:hypothetical protein